MNSISTATRTARPTLAALLVALAMLAIGACGGDDETTEASSPTAQSAPESTSTTDAPDDSDASGGDDAKSSGGSGDDGGDDGVTADGRDRSIQTFGDPADSETEKAMVAAVEGYFGALANKDTAKACEYLADSATEQMEMLLEQAREQAQGGEIPDEAGGCEFFLQTAARAFSGPAAPDFDSMEFRSFRVEGERGFVLYKIPKRPNSFMPAALEDGTWKVAAIDGSPLP